jgi:hypothetical protein
VGNRLPALIARHRVDCRGLYLIGPVTNDQVCGLSAGSGNDSAKRQVGFDEWLALTRAYGRGLPVWLPTEIRRAEGLAPRAI